MPIRKDNVKVQSVYYNSAFKVSKEKKPEAQKSRKKKLSSEILQMNVQSIGNAMSFYSRKQALFVDSKMNITDHRTMIENFSLQPGVTVTSGAYIANNDALRKFHIDEQGKVKIKKKFFDKKLKGTHKTLQEIKNNKQGNADQMELDKKKTRKNKKLVNGDFLTLKSNRVGQRAMSVTSGGSSKRSNDKNMKVNPLIFN